MARGSRVAQIQAAKERKQKKIVVVGAVLLIALLAWQAPRYMQLISGSEEAVEEPPAETAPAPTGTGPVSLEPPALGGAAPAAPAAPPPGDLGDSDPVPAATAGQLVSFSLFASKDPFVQQVTEVPASGAAKEGADEQEDASKAEEEKPPPPPPPTSAVLSVNGTEEPVALDGEFPRSEPLFRLEKLGKRSAEIAIAGGAYADGKATVRLELGKTLTLMNTADGVRYELRLVSVGGEGPSGG